MSRSAVKAVAEVLPTDAAWAVSSFIHGPLLEHSHKVSGPLHGRLEGFHSHMSGVYRVVYEIDDEARTVRVLRVATALTPTGRAD